MKDNLICYTQGDDCTFRKILNNFEWLAIDGKCNVMPHLISETGERCRLNYCPSCGQNIRDVITAAPDAEEERRG